MNRLRSLLLTCFLVSATLVPSFAAAQTSDDERALELGRRGLGEYEAQKWAECARSFEEAEKLSHSPVLELYQARCLRGEKKLLRARELMRRVASASVAEDAPGPFRQAKIDAQAELALLERAIPTAVIVVTGADPKSVKLFVDQRSAELGVPVELDPGRHEANVIWSAPTGASARQETFELVEGQKDLRVALSFEQAGPKRTAEPPPPPPPPPPDAGPGGGLVPGAVLLGVGGAALIAGAVLGFVAIDGYDSLRENGCDSFDDDVDLICVNDDPAFDYDSAQGDFETADRMADASTGLLVSGGVVAAVGLVVMLAVPGEEKLTTQGGRVVIRF